MTVANPHRVVLAVALVAQLSSVASASRANDNETHLSEAPPLNLLPRAEGNQPSSGAAALRTLEGRYPGATLLDEAEFAEVIQGRPFRYRSEDSELVVVSPKEWFFEGGRYSTGHRVTSAGNYLFERGIVVITCDQTFLHLGQRRLFFRHEGRLFTANADGTGSVVQLILEP